MNKTIDINPSIFSLSRTKKNKGKKEKPNKIPLISPNILKNKLLKRIKEHKKKETENLDKKLDIKTNTNNNNNNNNNLKPDLVDLKSYTDEFNDSLNYLQTLSKQKKIDEEKSKNALIHQKKKEELERKTLRNYHSIHNSNNEGGAPHVNLDLPDELKEPLIVINTEQLKANNHDEVPIQIKMPVNAPLKNSLALYKQNSLAPYKQNSLAPYKQNSLAPDVPYGVLKGGNKPTYRIWNKTQKNMSNNQPFTSTIVNNHVSNERENRLNVLKEKIKQKQATTTNTINSVNSVNNKDLFMSQNLIHKPLTNANTNGNTNANTNATNTNINTNSNTILIKQKIKRTISRKYTVGKSKIKRMVSVLLKDRATRKKIIAAFKDLKKNNINDVKKYLREHNLIKIGSSAPNDVVRKIYEYGMMAGEITNNNQEMLLHNFIKDDKNEKIS